MPGTIIGAIVGYFIGWLIAVAQSRFTYLGGGYGMFEGLGCFVTLLIQIVCAGIGAAVGTLFWLLLQ